MTEPLGGTPSLSIGVARDPQSTKIIANSDELLDRLMRVAADLDQALDRLAGAQPPKVSEAMEEFGDGFMARLLHQHRRVAELIERIEDSAARLREVV